MDAAARPRHVRLVVASVQSAYDHEHAFAATAYDRAAGLVILSGPELFKDLMQLCALALAHYLPSAHQFRDFPLAGGLLSYGPDISDLSVLAAQLVTRILEDAKPAEMPVQQPTRFALVINVRAAKALGLDIPQRLLVRADEVIH
jgi:putative ABC transport system substrate-binding protein